MAVSGLLLSASAFIGLVMQENFTTEAVIPTINDRPTLGYGSTYWEDGSPVKMGQKVSPVRALRVAEAHITREEKIFRNSLPNVLLSQEEYDLYIDWVYQYGTGNWSSSSMRLALLRGDYVGSCRALLAYRKAAGYDCSTLVNGKPNKRCWGVWVRAKERHDACMEAQ